MAIQFLLNEVRVTLRERRRLKKFIATLFQHNKKDLENLLYVFCSDEYLLMINRQFLSHDDYTDIITFCLSEPSSPIIGEIYISVERVKENAADLNISIDKELHRVIFHGALHLCGYRDKKPADKKKMTTAENECLEEYFI